jgi:hypothetical protein
MNNTPTLTINKSTFSWVPKILGLLSAEWWVVILATSAAIVSTSFAYTHGYTVLYGDAESHLNIAKRVVDSLTPGFAQLGGIWLPLPHMLLMPFVYFDFLWRTGLAGSIVSGIAFVVSSLYIYKLTHLLTSKKVAALFASLVFICNPNILYLQATPMTELILIVFFVLSSYFFIRFLLDDTKLLMLIAAAGFGFCASLSRYDGWALVAMEAGILFLYYFPLRLNFTNEQEEFLRPTFGKRLLDSWHRLEGRTVLYVTLAFFGVFLWLMWSYLILGDALYFTHSQFSANSQQQNWLARGELPAYHNPLVSFLYYAVTSISSAGILLALTALIGVLYFMFGKKSRYKFYILLVLLVPFFFNVLTLFLGQSVIFIPSLTPITFEWRLFNVRYGVMMIPFFAIFIGYLFSSVRTLGRSLLVGVLIVQSLLFVIGFSTVLAWQDGYSGLSSATAKMPDAQFWLAKNYDYGLVLTDDYARTISIIRTPIPMDQIIYIGNKPYWDESLREPEKYARWIVMQKDDSVWKSIYDDPITNGRLFKYFNKVYTSDTVLIFRRIDDGTLVQ